MRSADRGFEVSLHEMRPVTTTPAHKTDRLAELVCSNTFKSTELTNAHGLLKAEMRLLGSLILTLTLVPVLASYWFTHGVKEVVNRPYEWVKRVYAGQLDWCLDHPKITMLLATPTLPPPGLNPSCTAYGSSVLILPEASLDAVHVNASLCTQGELNDALFYATVAIVGTHAAVWTLK